MANLITLEEYKNYKSISNPNKDSVLSTVISSVSDHIKAYCGRAFIDYYSDPKTELITVDAGVYNIILEEHPLKLVSAVTLDGVDITSDIAVDQDLGIVHYPSGFKRGTDIIEVVYTAGFEETPADVKLAAFELVDYFINSEHKSRKSLSGSTIEYHPNESGWPFHIRGLLDMYKDV